MEEFEFKVDLNTPYIKAIRFIGALGLGFFTAAIMFSLKYEDTVNWLNSVTGIMCCMFLHFFWSS